jgi:hypothetical protein
MDRYKDIISTEKVSNGIVCYKNLKYPIIPLSINDIYVITTSGDRFDLLAQQYYNDSSLWWIISLANDNLPQNSLYPPVGEQIRIPTNITNILTEYRNLNQNI